MFASVVKCPVGPTREVGKRGDVLIFIMGTSAEMNRSPFDTLEAESEIIAGYHTEYSGMKFGIFQLAEFAAVLITSALAATLFLQGWRWPFLPSPVWFLVKLFGFCFLDSGTLFSLINADLRGIHLKICIENWVK